jgi:hypothetical protein
MSSPSDERGRVVPFRARPGSEPLATKAQLAAHLQVHARTIERRVDAGMPLHPRRCPRRPISDSGVRGLAGGAGMTIRKRGKRWSVEVYDATVASKKRYVGTFESQADAREAARVAEGDVARRRGRRADETVSGWAGRWLDLRPRQKESTNIAYREQVAPFQKAHGERRLRDVTVELALEWAGEHRWTVGGIRAIFSDARRAGLIEGNRSQDCGSEGPTGARIWTF